MAIDWTRPPFPAKGDGDMAGAGLPSTAGDGLGPDPSLIVPPPTTAPARSLWERAEEARELLQPARIEVPAPRCGAGVVLPRMFPRSTDAPAADVSRAADELVADLAALDRDPDTPEHRAFARAHALTSAGVPEQGWSAPEGIAVEALTAAAARAAALHDRAVALLERLDAEERPSPAVVVGGLVTSLRVVRMVADLEVFDRRRSAAELDHGDRRRSAAELDHGDRRRSAAELDHGDRRRSAADPDPGRHRR